MSVLVMLQTWIDARCFYFYYLHACLSLYFEVLLKVSNEMNLIASYRLSQTPMPNLTKTMRRTDRPSTSVT